MMQYRETKKIIKKANSIYIVGHKNPDGDSIGSSFALYLALKKMNKNVNVILSTHSYIFDFLPHIEDGVENIKEDSIDLLIMLDSSDLERVSLSAEDVKKAKKIIRIDHHHSNAYINSGDIIDTESPATSQIVYEFISNLKVDLDKDIATYLYAGILTDTGSFNYATTTKRTLEIVSKLVGLGINFPYICKKLNDTMKESKLKLIAKTIENMEVMYDGKIRYSYVDYDTIKSLGVDEEDAEGMTNYLKKVDGTEVAIYVRGKSNGTNKVSLRSGDKVDVSKIAISFGGGGHKRAAGYTMDKTKNIDICKKELMDKILEELN